jgi:HD superfamily phosphodiesterase
VRVPDSRTAREAEELLREAAPPFLANHSHRSYHFATALAERERVRFDAELLYVAALLHDVGLVARFDTGRCFELDGADAARRLAAEQGWPAERAEAAAEAIRLHVAAEIALADGPEAYLLNHATGFDVRGHRWDDVDAATVASVLAAHPRLDFEAGFTALLRDQADRKPGCWAHAAIAGGIAEAIASSPFVRAA